MPFVPKEFSGVFETTLKEDMIDTVTETKQPFINCDLSSLLGKTDEYPYVYVPSWFLVYPLRKNDKVQIRFYQDNHSYPYLWKPLIDWEMDENLYKKYNLPQKKQLVTFPTTQPTISSYKINQDCYIISTDSYSFLRYNDQILIADKSGFRISADTFGLLVNTIQLEVSQKMEIKVKELVLEASQSIKLKSGATSIELDGLTGNLKMNTVTAESTGMVKTPKAGGGFLNAIPVDALTGLPHQG